MEEYSDICKRERPKVPPNSAKRWSLPLDTSCPPPVCSVHPGRTLELTTTIGISKMRDELFNTYVYPLDEETRNNYSFIEQRSRLKSGRLKPLGLHIDPFLSSKTCLGVIPVDRRKKYHRSLTAPAHRPESREHGGYTVWDNRTNKQSGYNRRAYSANPNTMFEINSTKLEQKPGAQLEQKPGAQLPTLSNLMNTSLKEVEGGVSLPPVKTNTATLNYQPDIRIEIKGKSESSNNREEILDSQQPHLYDVNSDVNERTNIINISPVKDKTMSITNTTSERNKVRVRKVSGSGSSVKGKLSHGWSSPQPLVPLKGQFPPITDTKRLRTIKSKETLPDCLDGNSSIAVDINEILSNS